MNIVHLQNTVARPVAGVSFAASDKQLFAGGSGGYDIWNIAAQSHSFFASRNVGLYFGCSADPKGRWVYVSDSQNGFRILTPAGDSLPHLGEYRTHVRAFDLSPDGRRLVMSRGGGGSNSTECWDIRPSGAFALMWAQCDGTPFDSVEIPWCRSQWSIDGVAISPDGTRVLVAEERTSATRYPDIVLRDAKNGRELANLGQSKGSFATRLRFAANGKAAFACDDSILERWDIAGKSCSHTAAAPAKRRMVAFAIGEHGVFTAAGKNVYRWNPGDLSLEETLSPEIGKVHSLAIDTRGKRIAAGGDKGQVAVWDL